VTAAATVVALAGTALVTPAAHAATSGDVPAAGVVFHGMWSSYSDAQRAEVLDKMAAAHVGWVRLDVSWAMLQPNGPDSYDAWGVSFIDRVLGMITARGIKPLVMLWMTPDWANGGKGARVAPTNPADYARAAEWAARRWANEVPAWEVWNEPNLDGFFAGADPVAYTKLLRAAYPAFHRGNPDVQVLFGAPSYNDTPWLTKAYAAGAHGSFDVMATHPYMGKADAAPETADDGSIWMLDHVAAVHDLMTAHGDGNKPVWFTEVGWSTHANWSGVQNWERGVSEATQAEYTVRTLKHVAAKFPYVDKIFFYTDRDDDSGRPHVDNFGMFRRDGSAKPVVAALKSYLTTVAPAVLPTPNAHWRHGSTVTRIAAGIKLRRG
jgi:beta-xylosidase